MFVAAAALETCARFAFVRDKAVEASAHKSLKARFARVVVGEVVLLKLVREEALREILRVFVAGLPLQPHVLVNGFPVAGEDCIERALPYVLVHAAGAHDGRLVRLRKTIAHAADVCVWIHLGSEMSFFFPQRQDCLTLRTHEAIPSHLWSGPARGFSAHRAVHGSLSRTLEKHARWSTNALPHAPHLHSVFRIAAPGNRHVHHLSRGCAATHLTDRWYGARNRRFRVVYHSLLLRATAHTLVRAAFQSGRDHDDERHPTARAEWS